MVMYMSWASVTSKGSEESWDWGCPKWLTRWPKAIPPQGFSQSGSSGMSQGPWSQVSLICSQGPCVGPTVARDCVVIYSACYHRGLWGCPTCVGLGSLVGVQEASCSWSDANLRSLCCHLGPWWHQNPGCWRGPWMGPLTARVYADVHGPWYHQRHMDAQGLGHVGVRELYRPAQLPPEPTFWPSNWPILTSTTSMTCWSVWRNWSCGMIAARSPWLGQQQDVWEEFLWGPVMMGCQRPWPRLVTEHFVDGADCKKGYIMWHTAAHNAARLNDEWRGVGQTEEWVGPFFVCVSILFCFELICWWGFRGAYHRGKGRIWRDWEVRGIGVHDVKLQRINKELLV